MPQNVIGVDIAGLRSDSHNLARAAFTLDLVCVQKLCVGKCKRNEVPGKSCFCLRHSPPL
jgi:hypothetical protein